MSGFVPGKQLCGEFFEEVVRPILARSCPDLKFAAALIGEGSEVLGFDDPMSTDHAWAPRVQVFLNDDEPTEVVSAILDAAVPESFRGYPTHVIMGGPHAEAPRHRIDVLTIQGYLLDYLGFDVERDIHAADWLTFPEQKIRALTEGAVYQDEIGLKATLDRFAYYPRDVWLYLLAAGWNRIGQEEHLTGRAGMAGDEIGAALICARLVRDLMRLCFLMERRYAPYPKWFGTAFRQLTCAKELLPIFAEALAARHWQEREYHLVAAYAIVARMHNALGVTDPRPVQPAPFFDRPFQVIHLHGGFAQAIVEQIEDPEVRRIASCPLIGSIDQWSDSTDILCDARLREDLHAVYIRHSAHD